MGTAFCTCKRSETYIFILFKCGLHLSSVYRNTNLLQIHNPKVKPPLQPHQKTQDVEHLANLPPSNPELPCTQLLSVMDTQYGKPAAFNRLIYSGRCSHLALAVLVSGYSILSVLCTVHTTLNKALYKESHNPSNFGTQMKYFK